MMTYENKNGLKGQQNLAQGKRSGALGWKTDMKIVRAITFIKAKILFRTNEITLFSQKMMSYNSVRKKLFALFIEFPRTVFLLHLLPRAAFRIVPPETLPWAMIFWPFRPEENFDINLCIKSRCVVEGLGFSTKVKF
jgi:hypothetical protein